MANQVHLMGYDTTNKIFRYIDVNSDGQIGTSAGSTGSTATAALQQTQIDILNELGTSVKQDTTNNTLAGISANIELTLPGISGPNLLYQGTTSAAGTSVGVDVSMGNYRNITLFGKTDVAATWRIVYKNDAGDLFPSGNGVTSTQLVSGTSFNLNYTWENVGADTVTFDIINTSSVYSDLYYTLSRQ